MITIKAYEIPGIMEAGKELFEKPMDADLAYRLSKLLVSLQPELEAFEMARLKLCAKYAEKDENGQAKKNAAGHFEISDIDSFKIEFNKLANADVYVNFSPIKLSDIKKQELQVRPMDLAKLYKLITD